jgi:hypothetical protein
MHQEAHQPETVPHLGSITPNQCIAIGFDGAADAEAPAW